MGNAEGNGARVCDVMSTAVLTVRPTDSIESAADLMETYGQSVVAVVDGDQRCLGVLRRIDLPDAGSTRANIGRDGVSQVCAARATVARHMLARSVTVLSNWPIRLAENEMKMHHLDQLPVVDQNGMVVGMVTLVDASDTPKPKPR